MLMRGSTLILMLSLIWVRSLFGSIRNSMSYRRILLREGASLRIIRFLFMRRLLRDRLSLMVLRKSKPAASGSQTN